jgi:RNA polymerase sigma factor (sigma-70 family)
VVAAQLGDRAALDELLRSIQEPLARHLGYVMGDADAADDALQDALLMISRKLRTLRDPRWFRAWAFRVATRIAVRQSRKARSALAVTLEDAPELAVPAEDAPPFDDQEIAAVQLALGSAPPASQLVLRMHYENGLTHPEIAEALDISIGTVKSRHHYGLEWLRRHFRERVAR